VGYADRGKRAPFVDEKAVEGAGRDDAARRLPAFKDIPAIGEAGLGDDSRGASLAGACWCATGRLPKIVATLHRAIVQAMALPDTKARIEAMSVEPMATDPAAFDAFFKAEVTRWTEGGAAGGP